MTRFKKILACFTVVLALTGCGGAMRAESPALTTAARGSSGGGYAAEAAGADYGGGGEAAGSYAAPTAAPGGGDMIAPPPPPPSSPMAPVTVAGGVATTTTTTITVRPGVMPPYVVEQQIPAGGLLTAASVGDVDRRGAYLEYLGRHGAERGLLGIDMSRRVRVRVVDGVGRPVNDARILLNGAGVQAQGRTHADGVWDFYPSFAAPQSGGTATATIDIGQTRVQTNVEIPAQGDGPETVVRLNGLVAAAPQALDLGFLIDVTGSMEDELRYVNREVADITMRIRRQMPQTDIRVGATFYRDRGDAELVQQIGFSANVPGFASAMQNVHASGGGDYPEDMNTGLEFALRRMAWRQGNAVRVLVVIADAPPQQYADSQFTYRHAMNDASARGIRILPVAASGAERSVEYLFRAMGAATSTPYVYLTNDSGIGNDHQEADTDRVAVEQFNRLLVRMVLADLAGEGMHEPGAFGPRTGQ